MTEVIYNPIDPNIRLKSVILYCLLLNLKNDFKEFYAFFLKKKKSQTSFKQWKVKVRIVGERLRWIDKKINKKQKTVTTHQYSEEMQFL